MKDKLIASKELLSYESWIEPVARLSEQVGSRDVDNEVERLKTEGREVIEVYGFPTTPLPEHGRQAAIEALSCTCSPPSNGLPELRESLSRVLFEQYRVAVNPENEILVTNGAMHALNVVFRALLGPGDEPLLISPCYFFGGLIELTGARPVYVEMDKRGDYALDVEKIRREVHAKTKLLILNTPVNPTGYVYSRSDVEELVSLAEECNLLMVCDESYDRMIYDDMQHVSPFASPEGNKRTILVKSFTKSYALPSWRVGYVVASAVLIGYFRKLLEWNVLTCPDLNQRVALAILDGPQDWLLEVSRSFERNRNTLLRGIADLQEFSYAKPRGGPFIFLDVSKKADDSSQFARDLLDHFGVPAVPGKYFNNQHCVRIPFGGSDESVTKLVDALRRAANS